MINKELFASVFKNYGIERVLLNKDESNYNFIISQMNNNISLERWEQLENILKDITKSNVNIFGLEQATKYLSNTYIEESMVIL